MLGYKNNQTCWKIIIGKPSTWLGSSQTSLLLIILFSFWEKKTKKKKLIRLKLSFLIAVSWYVIVLVYHYHNYFSSGIGKWKGGKHAWSLYSFTVTQRGTREQGEQTDGMDRGGEMTGLNWLAGCSYQEESGSDVHHRSCGLIAIFFFLFFIYIYMSNRQREAFSFLSYTVLVRREEPLCCLLIPYYSQRLLQPDAGLVYCLRTPDTVNYPAQGFITSCSTLIQFSKVNCPALTIQQLNHW